MKDCFAEIPVSLISPRAFSDYSREELILYRSQIEVSLSKRKVEVRDPERMFLNRSFNFGRAYGPE